MLTWHSLQLIDMLSQPLKVFHRCRGLKMWLSGQIFKSFNPVISLSLINASLFCFFQEGCPRLDQRKTSSPGFHSLHLASGMTQWVDILSQGKRYWYCLEILERKKLLLTTVRNKTKKNKHLCYLQTLGMSNCLKRQDCSKFVITYTCIHVRSTYCILQISTPSDKSKKCKETLCHSSLSTSSICAYTNYKFNSKTFVSLQNLQIMMV